MQNDPKNKPIKVFRCGAVQAAIWTNQRVIDDAVVEVHSVRIDKSYKEADEWKRTTSFAAEDLPKVAMIATEAYRFLRLRSSENGPNTPENLFATGRSAPDEEPSSHEEI